MDDLDNFMAASTDLTTLGASVGCFVAGTTVKTEDGDKDIEEIEFLDEPVTVYNFEVKDWHCYFVGEAGVLAHNSNLEACTEATKIAENAGGKAGDDSGESGKNSTLALPVPSGTNPWLEGSDIVSMPAPADCYIDMALAPSQNKPGGWGTFDNIPDIDHVRNSLAVTPKFKPKVGYVQRYKIPEGVRIQVGIVGPQTYQGKIYTGGGNQVQILNFNDRAKLIPIGKKRPIY